MAQQQYKNHIRFYPPHHFIFYPLITACFVIAGIQAYKHPETRLEWIAITALFLFVTWLSFMLRQHYALTLQNRVVVLELRLRYYQLTGKRLEDIESTLSFSQLAALRFAPDAELPALVERTIVEDLSPDAIKKSIKNWLADNRRV